MIIDADLPVIRIQRSRLLIVVAVVASYLGAAGGAARTQQLEPLQSPHTEIACNRYASPGGSDQKGRGTWRSPFASLARLDRALRPGQTGCLRSGTYGGLNAWHQIDTDGRSGARITITSYPGELATVVGEVDLEGSYTTLSHLRIDGSNTLKRQPVEPSCPSPVSESLVIAGHDDTLEYTDYYQSVPGLRGNGIGVGFWGDADNTVIRFNKIHDVGQCLAHDHLIYLAHGNNVQIYDNWLWNDPHGRGILLYPGPTNARVWGNVIDSTGIGFGLGNEPGENASGNAIFHNVVINSTGLPSDNLPGAAIHVDWGGTPGQGNTFNYNDSYNNPGGIGRHPGVTAVGNTTADPQLPYASAHIYVSVQKHRRTR
jgi:hypothetical protein